MGGETLNSNNGGAVHLNAGNATEGVGGDIFIKGGSSGISKGGAVIISGGRGSTLGDVDIEGSRLEIAIQDEINIASSTEFRMESANIDVDALIVEVGHHENVALQIDNSIKQVSISSDSLLVKGTTETSKSEFFVPIISHHPTFYAAEKETIAKGTLPVYSGVLETGDLQLTAESSFAVKKIKVDGVKLGDHVNTTPNFNIFQESYGLTWSAWTGEGFVFIRVINIESTDLELESTSWSVKIERRVCLDIQTGKIIKKC